LIEKCLQDPNVDDPLNKEAATMLSTQPAKFTKLVARSITHGETIEGTYFAACLAT
jgi:ubiquitin-protein ligase